MIYYKIPLTGGLDYPAGCILCCAYTYNGYEYCKFERVTEVGSGWVKITESEFNVRCPEFPAPADDGYAVISDWDDLDSLLEDAVSVMAVHTGRSYSLNFTLDIPYGAARLTVYKGLDDDGFEQVRVDLAVTDGHTLHRTALNDWSGSWEWSDWAWDNPPMKAGAEYLTTEKTIGHPVYTKRLVLETPDVGDSAYVDIVTSSNYPTVLSMEGNVEDRHVLTQWMFPVISNTGKILATASIKTSGSIDSEITLGLEISTLDASVSRLPAVFCVKYTK